MKKKNLSVIFKPTLSCNLRCKYCYATGEETPHKKMSDEEIIHTFNWLAEYCDCAGYNKIRIIWHGGEPLLLSPSTLDAVLSKGKEIFSDHSISLLYSIQSNLTVINDEYISIIKKHFNSRIGGSLDFETDARIFPDGSNSDSVVLPKIKTLKNAGIRVGVITLLCDANIPNIELLYDFFKREKINVTLTHAFPTQLDKNYGEYEVSEEEYAKVLCKLFDIWFNDKEQPPHISNFVNAATALLTGFDKCCASSPTCQPHFMGIGPDGDLYPCGRFAGEKSSLGNIFRISPETYFNEGRQIQFAKALPISESCLSCEYIDICNGSCMYERLVKKPVEMKTCSIYSLYKHIEDVLETRHLKRNMFRGLSTGEFQEYMSENI